VTCHLTCPVTDFATRTSRTTQFVSQRFKRFPPLWRPMKAGGWSVLQIAPLAMKLREQGLPVKILYLGHRDGSEVMVRRDLPADKPPRSAQQGLSRFRASTAYQNLVIHKLMEDRAGSTTERDSFVEDASSGYARSVASKAIDA